MNTNVRNGVLLIIVSTILVAIIMVAFIIPSLNFISISTDDEILHHKISWEDKYSDNCNLSEIKMINSGRTCYLIECNDNVEAMGCV